MKLITGNYSGRMTRLEKRGSWTRRRLKARMVS